MAGAPSGGAELFFERLTTAMAATGDEVLPVIRHDPARSGRLRQAGLEPLQLAFGGALDLFTRPRLAQLLQSFAPRLVMAWMSRAAALTPRGDYVLAGRLGGYYDLRRFARCDHLVANTGGLVAWIERQGWPAARVHHLPNFVPDLRGAAPAALPAPPGAPVVLALGRLHRNKAFDILIDAVRRLPGVHAVIAGDGPERARLEAQSRADGVAGRVHFLGWRSDQASLLAAASVLCCPSRQEPLGNVIIEAFSAGVPVVAAAAPGPAELIRPGQTGLLVPPEQADDLAAALSAVLEDRVLAFRLGASGRAEFRAVHAQAPVLARWRRCLSALERT